jgi:integrating conjugative element membrane protein (TIGR03745 family)
MKSLLHSLRARARHGLLAVVASVVAAASGTVQAQGTLPTPIDPNIGGAPGGNWLELIRGYIGDGAVILGLAIATVGLLWVAYTGVAKFNECRTGKAEWSELGVLGVVGAVVLLFMMFLLNEAATIIT